MADIIDATEQDYVNAAKRKLLTQVCDGKHIDTRYCVGLGFDGENITVEVVESEAIQEAVVRVGQQLVIDELTRALRASNAVIDMLAKELTGDEYVELLKNNPHTIEFPMDTYNFVMKCRMEKARAK